jgi:glucan phosphoethanolaminetransferase (alkaline phosphatase superfamily)
VSDGLYLESISVEIDSVATERLSISEKLFALSFSFQFFSETVNPSDGFEPHLYSYLCSSVANFLLRLSVVYAPKFLQFFLIFIII